MDDVSPRYSSPGPRSYCSVCRHYVANVRALYPRARVYLLGGL